MRTNNDSDRREYWFMRLREKFFDDRELVDIESLDEAFFGANFCYLVEILYLKLMCYSIRDEGQIYFVVEREGAKDLADCIIAKKFFPESKKTQVRQALAILEDIGLISVDMTPLSTTIYIPEVDNMTGRSTKHADAQRKIDNRKKVPQIEEQRRAECKAYGKAQNIFLTEEEYADLENRASDQQLYLSRIIENVSFLKETVGYPDDDYQACLKELGGSATAIAVRK